LFCPIRNNNNKGVTVRGERESRKKQLTLWPPKSAVGKKKTGKKIVIVELSILIFKY